MSNGENGSGAPSDKDTSGTGKNDNSNQNNKDKSDAGNSDKTIAYSEHKKKMDEVLGDMHKFKEELKQTKDKLSALETEKLKNNQDYKSLWEQTQKAKEEAEAKAEKLTSAIFETQRFDAVKTAAMQAGILNEALGDLELIKLDDIVVETTSQGRYIVNGAKEKVESLKKEKPHWFKKPGAPNVNAGGGSTGNTTNGELTATYMEALKLKDMKKYKELLPDYVKQAVARKSKKQ